MKRIIFFLSIFLEVNTIFAQEKMIVAEDSVTDNLVTAILSHNLATSYYNDGKFPEAMEFEEITVNILEELHWEVDSLYIMALSNHVSYKLVNGKFDEALKLGTKVLEIEKKTHGVESGNYAQSLSVLASCYAFKGNYEEAVKLQTNAVDIRRKIFGSENIFLAKSLYLLASYQVELNNFSEAMALATEAVEIFEKKAGENDSEYALSLICLAVCKRSLGKFFESLELAMKSSNILRLAIGDHHPTYATSLTVLADAYASLAKYTEAVKLYTEAIDIIREKLSKSHPNYSIMLNNLASYLSCQGKYEEAIKIATEALLIRGKIYGTTSHFYAYNLGKLAFYLSENGNNDEAIKFATDAVEITKKIFGTKHLKYALELNTLSICLFRSNNCSEALRLSYEALKILKNEVGVDNSYFAMVLDNLACYQSNLGNFEEAIEMEKEAMNIRKILLGPEHPDYLLSLNNLAAILYQIGKIREAISFMQEAVEIRKKILGEKHPYYATSLYNLALFLFKNKQYVESAKLNYKAYIIRSEEFGMEHPDCILSLNFLAECYFLLGEIDSALNIGKMTLDICIKALGKGTPFSVLLLYNLANYYQSQGNYTESKRLLKLSLDTSQSNVIRSFSGLSPHLQESLWQGKYDHLFHSAFPSLVFRSQDAESLSYLYDKTALFSKGVLLNTGIEMRELILESNDTALIKKYKLLSQNKSKYYKILEKPIRERHENVDSLNRFLHQQELELAHDSKVYGDFSRNMQICRKDVQDKLDIDDIAIEFLNFPLWETDSTMYVALTLKKGYDCPHMVTLFEKKQLDVVPDSIYYCSDRLYNLVWKPLEEELQGVRDIYFSPSGELHRIGIEYLPKSNGEIICDIYALHRLSSTRQLALAQDDTNGKDFILFGGMDYYADLNAKTPNTDSNPKSKQDLTVTHRINVESLGLQGPFQNLVSTKEETDQISEILNTHGIKHNYFHDAQATEESFKNLDGTRPRVIHIATHGKYLTKAEAEQEKKKERGPTFATPQMEGLLGEGLSMDRFVEDRALTRSYLLFSGGNHILNHEQIPEGVEDGILTAQEISRMDLRGLDLLVLSACQTGMGDIFSGEGVFGLQRGFKKAGAKTIIMSLWEVDDKYTMILMDNFYQHYLNGETKEAAFRKAQDELRRQSPYSQKPNWAAFVMLDGIN